MKDPKDVLRDLKNACRIRPKGVIHADGSCDWYLAGDAWGCVWRAMNSAGEVIEYLLRERDSLMDLLGTEDKNADHIG